MQTARTVGSYLLLVALAWSPHSSATEGTWFPGRFPGSEPTSTGQREFRVILGSGLRRLDVDALNTELDGLDAHHYVDTFRAKPGIVSTELLLNGHGMGFEFASFDNLESDKIQNDYQNNITFFSLSLSYYRVVYGSSWLRLYPGVSLGFAELHNVIQPYAPSGIEFSEVIASPRQSSHLVTNAYTASLFVEAEFPFWMWGTAGHHQGGLSLGLRAGYVQELSKSAPEETWVQHGQQVRGGPELSFSGPLLQAHIAVVFGD